MTKKKVKYRLITIEEEFARFGADGQWRKIWRKVRAERRHFESVSQCRVQAVQMMQDYNAEHHDGKFNLYSMWYQCYKMPVEENRLPIFVLHNRQFKGWQLKTIGECIAELRKKLRGSSQSIG